MRLGAVGVLSPLLMQAGRLQVRESNGEREGGGSEVGEGGGGGGSALTIVQYSSVEF